MKLTRTNYQLTEEILTEADINRGFRVDKAEKIENEITSAITSAGYKCKFKDDAGFYILPKNKYLAQLILKFELLKADEASSIDDGTISIQIFDAKQKKLSVSNMTDTKLNADEFDSAMEKIMPVIIDSILSPKQILNEGIFGDIINKISGKIDKKIAANSISKNVETILTSIDEELQVKLNQALKEAGNESAISISSNIKNDTLTIDFNCSFIAAIAYTPDMKNLKNLTVAKIKTPFGDVNTKGSKLAEIEAMLAALGKALDIEFPDISNIIFSDLEKNYELEKSQDLEDNLEKEESEDTEQKTSSGVDTTLSYIDNIKASFSPEIQSMLPESLLNQSLKEEKLRIQLSNPNAGIVYNQIKSKLSNRDEVANLVRYFLYKEANQITDKELDKATIYDIVDLINTAHGGFVIAVNVELAAVLQYIRYYRRLPMNFIPTITETSNRTQLQSYLRKHVTDILPLSENEKIKIPEQALDAALDSRLAVIYLKALFETQNGNTPEDLASIITTWEGTSTKELSTIGKDSPDTLKELFPNLSEDKYDSGKEIKKLIFTEKSNRFRHFGIITRLIQTLGVNSAKNITVDPNDAISSIVKNIKTQNQFSMDKLLSVLKAVDLSDTQKLDIGKAIIKVLKPEVEF